jgi:hypothetical protein
VLIHILPIIGAARAALDKFEETIKTQKSFYDPTLLRAGGNPFEGADGVQGDEPAF